MTIRELIALLTALPDHSLRVVAPGPEDCGYADITTVQSIRLILNDTTRIFGGPHTDASEWIQPPAGAVVVDAIVIDT